MDAPTPSWEDLKKLAKDPERDAGRRISKPKHPGPPPCDGSKTSYPGRGTARHAARTIQRKARGPELRAYLCTCGSWRLGHATRPTTYLRRRAQADKRRRR